MNWNCRNRVQATGQYQPTDPATGRRVGNVVSPQHVGRQQPLPGTLRVRNRGKVNHGVGSSEHPTTGARIRHIQCGNLAAALQIGMQHIPSSRQQRNDALPIRPPAPVSTTRRPTTSSTLPMTRLDRLRG